MRKRVGILISGRGSNMAALVRAAAQPGYPAEIAIVISHKADAPGLQVAREMGIEAVAIAARMPEFEVEADRLLHERGVEIVCLAGFMRLLSTGFVERWRDRLLNVHPSLLPAFPGLDAQAQALAAGVKIAGCTVHLVRPEMDTGPILMQAAVPVLPDDSVDTLSIRIIRREHEIYPAALARLARGEVRIDGEIAHLADVARDDRMIVPNP
ncbi:phosphoribosylglycinamide formyltransferase [Lutibaculum baratangense]|uniref:Phosphoribosylglycinamide formyltransferase n=1 Tax=Lutibaculum baratangense AMV1 TaxID=631454 RepID=V4RPK3_9HYPH|nr:phosphoribosylglycinamide formyltransferase [Lutibaculum baratangense]ESR27214.1 Phosphoribosylglycinamide formyltransferase [Lutibaculum baratangense AMV1]